MEKEEEETSSVGDVHVQVDDDRLIYETPNTGVHSKVFVDEALGDTIVEVISPIFEKNKRTQKRATPLLTPFTSD